MINKNQFIENCKNSGKFNYLQIEEIRYGFTQSLTMEEVKLYAMPEFEWQQMQEIRWGFEDGLTIEQVKIYASPEFSWNQMHKIREFIIENKDIYVNTLNFLIRLEVL